MNTARSLVALGVVLALGSSQAVWAAQQVEEDSAYQWGRWAVLSPAAGGEPYVAPQEPDAAKNLRPGEAEEVTPNGLFAATLPPVEPPIEPPVQPPIEPPIEPPVQPPIEPPIEVAGFCDAGSACGYATYSKNTAESESLQAAAVPEGFDLSDKNTDGPVLARFNLDTFPIEGDEGQYYEDDRHYEDDRYEASSVSEEGEGNSSGARFQVFDTGNEDFPDIESVDMEGDGSFVGTERSRTIVKKEDGSQITTNFTSRVSTIQEQYDFDEVDTGAWSDETSTRSEINTADGLNVQFDFSSPGGFFVFGKTATIDQMETFAAGNVIAVYQGAVIDYGSAVTMEFDLGEQTVHAEFASENGFNGFHAHGGVDGINFAGSDGDNKFTGSFFSAGENVSGAVNNGSQLGVFSADHVHPLAR